MSDLVTRLRALADLYGTTSATVMPHGKIGRALREAADALEHRESYDKSEAKRAYDFEHALGHCQAERDDLKAKLAEADALRSNAETGWTDTLDHLRKAEAEAAALREALEGMLSCYDTCTPSHKWAPVLAASRDALSHPGPGAALLERVKRYAYCKEVARAEKAEAEVLAETHDFEDEMRALKATLEGAIVGGCARAEKAEAEAAALREALTPLAMDDETAMSFEGPYFAITIRDALSHPGPGAALLERLRTLEAELAAWKAIDGSAYVERVKKLEAVASLVRVALAAPSWDALAPDFNDHLDAALAALEETP